MAKALQLPFLLILVLGMFLEFLTQEKAEVRLRTERIERAIKTEEKKLKKFENALDTAQLEWADSCKAKEFQLISRALLENTKSTSVLFEDSILTKHAQRNLDSLESILYRRMRQVSNKTKCDSVRASRRAL